MIPSLQEVTQLSPTDAAELMARWNDTLIETLRAQPPMVFCANKLILEQFTGLFDRYSSQHIYLKNPTDSLTDPPTEQDRALITLVNEMLLQCRVSDDYNLQSDFYLYKDNTYTRLEDSSQKEIRALIEKLLEPDDYLNALGRFWNTNHSPIQHPPRTFIAQAVALLIQCEASLRFQTASLEPASVALVRQLTTAVLPETLYIFHLDLQDTAHNNEIALVSAFALCTWSPDEQRSTNPTVLYLPGQPMAEFANPMALKTHLMRLFKSMRGRQQLLASVAHRQHSAFENLAQRANQDGRVNLIPVTATDNFFNHQVSLLIAKQRQDIEHHWAVSHSAPEGVLAVINRAANLASLLNFSEAIEQYARKLLTLSEQRTQARRAAQQQQIQLKTYRTTDFTGLVAQLESLQTRGAGQQLADSFFTPHRQSPLYKACARAVDVLRKLKDDPDFSDWLSKRSNKIENIPTPLTALEKLISNQPAIVDSPLTRFTIQGELLPLSELSAYFRNDVNVLIEARRDIGDGIREDGTVRFDLALKFYGVHIASHHPLELVIEWVQERAATLSLEMDEGRLPFDDIIDEQEDASLQQLLDQRRLNGSHSIFKQLTEDFLTPEREVQALKTPTVLLEQWLETEQCIVLGKQLVRALDWYTTDDEPPSARLLRGLVWRAFWLDFEGPTGNAQGTIAGEKIATPLHWGRSYSYIRQQIEQSLTRRHHLTPGGVQLALRLVRQASAAEIWVKEIPDDVLYASSIVWVNFKAGVILANAIAPGTAQHMTFQQLLGLSATTNRDATPEQQLVISLARLEPAVEWAIANGVLPDTKTEPTPEQAQSAVEALEQQEHEIVQATETISKRPPGRWRFTTDEAFNRGFSDYLAGVKVAYQTVIRALLPNLPLSDRTAIENGQVTLYALRQELRDVQVGHETAEKIAAARGRHGFIIQAKVSHSTTYYEVFPRAAMIRARPDIQTLTINGNIVVKNTGSSSRPSKGTFRLATSMPFDWAAYQNGQRPRDAISSQVIVEQIGHVLPATVPTPSANTRAPQSFSSERSRQLAAIVAQDLFHTEESNLKLLAERNTSIFDAGRQVIEDFVYYAKMLVPFWSGIEDIASGDPQRLESGALSLFNDLVSFGVPVGKYIGGSVRLAAQAGRISFQAALPRFATLTRTFLLATINELNPLEALPSLLKIGGLSVLRLGAATVRQVDAGLALFRKALSKPTIAPPGRTLQSVDPRTWTPLETQDRLFTVAGVDHVPMRSVGTDLLPEYRLIDPLTNTVFGPRYIPFGEEGLQRLPNIDDYIAPVSYEQTVEFSRRANGVYDGKHQQSYVRARGQWYAVETRYNLTGETEFYIVHPHNKTRPGYRIVNKDGMWLPVDESGSAGGKKLKKIQKAMADQREYYDAAYTRMSNAHARLDSAAKSTDFGMRHPLYDKSRLHVEAAEELNLIQVTNNKLPVFKPQDFITTPDLGRSRLITSIEEANSLGPRYAAVIDDLEGYLAVQQKHLQPMKALFEGEGPFKTIIGAKNLAVNTIIEQAKVFKSLLDEDLEQMLRTLETLPTTGAPTAPLPSAPRILEPRTLRPILIAGDGPLSMKTVLSRPRANNSDIADILDNQGQRADTYIKLGEDKIWIKSAIKIKEPAALATSSQADITLELNAAVREMNDVVEEHDELIRFYRNKASSEPAGAEARLKFGATKLNQGADDLEAACITVTDEATREGLLAQARLFRENADRFNTMATLIRRDLTIKQPADASALEFLHSQPGILSIRKSLDRQPIVRHLPRPGSEDWMRVPVFLDEFQISANGKIWAYAHMHFEQASHSVPIKSHLTTPEQRGLAPAAQTDVGREGRRLDIYRAEIYWPQAKQMFYANTAS